MRHPLIALGTALALMLFLPAGPIAAANPPTAHATTYHGVFTSSMLIGCPTGVDDPPTVDVPLPAWGMWEAQVNGPKAHVEITIFSDFGSGPFHVDAFGGSKRGDAEALATGAGETFHLQIASDTFFTQEDYVLRGGNFEFRLTPYFDCAYASMYGVTR
jgi:hypothetical protein